ncbi:MAG: 6-phosphogluconolactonase [Propionibacteriaceae bacterium]
MNQIQVEESAQDAGSAAAQAAAEAILAAVAARGSARVIFASAPSQESMLGHLVQDSRIDWQLVHAFHMDEYLGLDMEQPQAFGRWLVDRLPGQVRFERIRTDGETAAEIDRYSALINQTQIDVTCLGVGVNGHIAFNEPGQTDFEDPRTVREIRLDDASRQQQVDDGLFATMADVPSAALTLTVPALVSARTMICTVLGTNKAGAVARALGGTVSEDCPASILRTHPDAAWFVDRQAAAGLPDDSDRSVPRSADLTGPLQGG